MLFNRLFILALSVAIVIAVAGSSEPALSSEAATHEQNLAMLKEIEADLAKKPDDVTYQLQHAAILGLLHRDEEAVAEANKLLLRNPKLRDAYLVRADGEANLKRYDDAVVSLDMVFRLSAPTPKLLLSKAKYLSNAKRYPEAIETVNRVIELEPSNVRAYGRRAYCYRCLFGPCDKALKDMEKVVLLDPSDAKAKSLLADLKKELMVKTSGSAR
ncbi:MAG: Tetratricopeptide repeat protein [Cyanobacteriota bacterium erpe_2018_sw_21hr_WHONDRS-SW48-000092_B_bin.40]|jgi:tetratricopeptide (TPR) repeat protein|nr:Tetratricopeptide repeat protein [Cyanobacteriota bacterium erpe_2018_sw_21hr_WHONDRS-SW48-000092_B_bin.40]